MPPPWLERLEVNPAAALGRFVIKGTVLPVDMLVELVESAVPHLDSPPDRGSGILQGDLELVDSL